MSRDERYGSRDLTWSRWHRYTFGSDATMIDLDAIGYCDKCKAPLYIVEATKDVGQRKATTIAERVAQGLGVSGWLVMYSPGEPCVCRSTAMVPGCQHGIVRMRVRRFWPDPSPLVRATPKALALALQEIRHQHALTCTIPVTPCSVTRS